MPDTRIQQLQQLRKADPGNPMVRFVLGRELLRTGRFRDALPPLREAIHLKPDYSAAYRELGRALVNLDDTTTARSVFRTGISVADTQGDVQTRREMEVLLKRLPGNPEDER